ncbi:MAG: glycoside hydrolase family 3 N-terminal domain-containing protein [Bacteroidales bacterium]|nr:glycoside hydrolase family 3 N-terminal domain-containing protein [Bacteroidales bacterium]MDT8374312.1 glycoside hydrolase family 3 N-terminal domain-containing protein [Bacteroidales bacterium]
MKPSAKLPYRDASLSVRKRVEDLMGRMTVEEKCAQLMGLWNGGVEDFKPEIFDDAGKMKEIFGRGCHSVHPAPFGIKETVKMRNAIQKYLVEETRLRIPAIFVDEGQHGMMRPEATVFPQAIGLACSWDTTLFEKVYNVVAREMRSRGTHHALTPVIDVCRDPRWGRTEETYGEDPYLNGMLSIAAVKGLQGGDTGKVGKENVAATLKHLVGHGESEGGLNQGPANYSVRVLRDYHIPPFKMCIDSAKPVSVMPSYNEVDGVPSHANRWLLKELLREEWGYKGMIVSDYYGVDHLFNKHFVCHDATEAAMTAFNCGVQYEFPQANMYRVLPELLKKKKIKKEDIDKAVEQVLTFKFSLGLFENPYVDEKQAISVSKSLAHKKTALKAAHESIVLLKNDGLLPLKKGKYKRIAVIGPCANDLWFGGYSGEPWEKVSLLDGIRTRAGNGTEVLFAPGCKLTINTTISYFNWKYDEIKFASRDENIKLIKEAVKVASGADLVILALGENEHLCREAWAQNHIGDNMTLDLFGDQGELADAITALGKPVVLYLMNGRPLSINTLAEKVPAILEGWYMGQETGTAAADIIFGEVNPSGKLTITFPKSAGQLPMYYNHKPSAQWQDYLSQDVKPLFHFGYGLSYTKFRYGKPVLRKSTIQKGETAKVTLEVTNAGKMAGDEIVQLYIRDVVSSVTRPVKELKGFARITLKPGKTKKVSFDITPEKLAFHNIDMKFVVEPGDFEIMTGSSSREEDLQKTVLTVI